MTIPAELVTVNAIGLTVSNIIWRRFKRAKPGLIERVYALNPGLADLGVVLRVGTTFTLPIDPVETKASTPALISLWD